jgi:hypothetical protein
LPLLAMAQTSVDRSDVPPDLAAQNEMKGGIMARPTRGLQRKPGG